MLPRRDWRDWKIAIVESDKFGGTCLNRGCIPSKMLIYAAEVAETIRKAGHYGVNAHIDGIDWTRVIGRVWDKIDPLAEGGEKWRNSQSNITVIKGQARFADGRILEVDGRRISSERIVLAAGSRPFVPSLPGIMDTPYHTSDTIMRLTAQPERMVILGGGYIGAEMGHFFGSLGTAVTIVDRGPTMLKQEDDEISRSFTDQFAKKYNVLLNTEVTRVRPEGQGVSVGLRVKGEERSLWADLFLVASGRVPNSDLLNVEAAGVAVNESGQVLIDPYLETTAPGIWSLGDLNSPIPLKHRANLEARMVAHNMTFPEDKLTLDAHITPHAVFTSPQVAAVGSTERDLVAAGTPYSVGKQRYSGTAYGWAMDDSESFVKVLAHTETRKLLGAHIIGPHSSMLIQPLIDAMHFGHTVNELGRGTMYIHPALTEVVEQALLNA